MKPATARRLVASALDKDLADRIQLGANGFMFFFIVRGDRAKARAAQLEDALKLLGYQDTMNFPLAGEWWQRRQKVDYVVRGRWACPLMLQEGTMLKLREGLTFTLNIVMEWPEPNASIYVVGTPKANIAPTHTEMTP